MRLTIDGQPQFGVTTKNSFVVDSDWTVEVASPNRLLTAIIFDPQILTLREATGTKWELLRAHEISSLAWFPDSRHMLYTDTDRSLTKGCSTVGIQNRLWVVDASNGDKFQIGSDDENLHRALLSPDGRALVALTGSGWADAGSIDLGLRFFQLDANRQAVLRLSPRDFAGLPVDPSGAGMFPLPQNTYSDIGVWQDNTHFTIGLNWTGAAGSGGSPGLYEFDLAGRRVVRTGNLTTP